MDETKGASLDDLFQDLMHPNPKIQEAACFTMAEKFPDEAMPKLLELFEHNDPKVYRAAVKGIGFFGYPAFGKVLEIFATTENQTARRCCPKAFVQLFKNFPNQPFPDEVMRMLEESIDDQDTVVVQGALMCLGQIGKQDLGGEDAVRILAKSLKSENIALVYSAAQALADVDHPKAEIVLKDLANDSDDPLITEAAESALARYQTLKASKNKAGENG